MQIQRTPIVNRTLGVSQHNPPWSQVQNSQGQDQARNRAQQSFGVPSNRSFRAPSSSDRSDSADEVENLLLHNLQPTRRVDNQSGWVHPSQRPRPVQQHGKLFVALLRYLEFTCICSNGSHYKQANRKIQAYRFASLDKHSGTVHSFTDSTHRLFVAIRLSCQTINRARM